MNFINIFDKILFAYGTIGEVVNTADCGSVMRGFDPHIVPHVRILSNFLVRLGIYKVFQKKNFFVVYKNEMICMNIIEKS